MPKGTEYISNPFQVLGKSDAPEPSAAPVAPASGSVAIAAPAAAPVASEGRPAALETIKTEAGEITPADLKPSHKALTFLHAVGSFMLKDVLPLVLQVGVPILEKRI